MEISGVGVTVVTLWKKQYLAEQRGETLDGKAPLDTDKLRIQDLEKQLAEAREVFVC